MSESPGSQNNQDHDKHGRKLSPLTRKDVPMRRFSDTVNREQLQDFLSSSGNERYETLFLLMQDPAYSGLAFGTLCKKAGVTLHEMHSLYTDGQRQLALLRMSNALPDLMADVAEDARTTMESCPRCDGFGFIKTAYGGTRDCPTCEGKLKVRRIGDRQARDLIFEAAKLTKQSGPLVAIQQNFGGGDSHLESILNKTRAIALDKPSTPVVETHHEEV